ncbi:NitT/TauT family transport system ATP-binding protein [Homoserinimonas aerilata]|uniref:NitT/TauT family transport system ATP-binding protein n=1 Tax=Homoserinimonas aerilata TaxID=1162970 RepID=A0A542YJV8_9MICO|nr:ABC transporter ATP-binding protein [Homoserinimonas aerilata]TQL48396.1 NitT/TauT family transport system ATP-binding protein [Homoserinimonas aerilata]
MSTSSPIKDVGTLRAVGVQKTFGTGSAANTIIADLDLELTPGDVTCLVGPSGVGKTTLLRLLSGLIQPSEGKVFLGDRSITGPVEDIAVVFQDYRGSMLPWMRVLGNVEFPLQARGVGKRERFERARRCLELVGLQDNMDKFPWQLSGGMQQRVAIARALAYDASILLMDEPFGSLDAQTRFELEELTLRLRRDLGITIIVVTHDIDEAVFLGDRVVVFGGRPSRIVDDVAVNLGREREQLATKARPEFIELRTRILSEIKNNGIPTSSVRLP